jgi:hypothetical protein
MSVKRFYLTDVNLFAFFPLVYLVVAQNPGDYQNILGHFRYDFRSCALMKISSVAAVFSFPFFAGVVVFRHFLLLRTVARFMSVKGSRTFRIIRFMMLTVYAVFGAFRFFFFHKFVSIY